MLSSGQLLAERYKLTSRIAVGGMGEVWEANDTRLDRVVAVKILKAELSGDAEFLHRFRTEARTTASLNHPGIAGVHDYGETIEPGQETEGNPVDPSEANHVAYLVMEMVRGEPLAGILAREGRISVERTLDVLEQAGNALQEAHASGLVHRDVKPGNILITATGQVKITDFGVSKAADSAPVTRTGMVMGTAHYIAPEQALGQAAEPASDVYSLAVCGYECLAGYRPFRSENAVTVAMMHIRDMPPPLPADVVGAVRTLIEATLIKDPRQRYRNGGEFAAAVTAARHGQPLPAPTTTYAQFSPAAPQRAIPQTGATPSQHPGPSSHPGPGSYSGIPPVPPQATPASGPIAPQLAPQRPRKQSNIPLRITLIVLIILLIVASALLIPMLFNDSSGGSPDPENPEDTDFGVTDTAHPPRSSDTALPSEQQSGLPLAPSTSESPPTDVPADGESRREPATGSGTHTSSWTVRPGRSEQRGVAVIGQTLVWTERNSTNR